MSEQEKEKKPRRRVKKVKGHGGHHGGAWKVAYADFVTAMMALFLVLWLVSQADTKVKQAIANHFRSPGIFSSVKGGILSGPTKVSKEPSELTAKEDEQALFNTAATLRQSFSTRPEFANAKNSIKIEVTDEGLRIQIVDKAERVSFGSGSADLNEETKAILTEIARGICVLPNHIVIGGHTDRHIYPAGSTYTNWELSADRANAARRVLTENCVKPEQVRRIVGYSDTEPLVPRDPFAPANRRISIVVLRLVAPATDKDENKAEQSSATPEREDKAAAVKGEDAQRDAREANAPEQDQPAGEAKPLAGGAQNSAEGRAPEHKLRAEGKVSVGEPDKLPNVKRTRE